MDIYDKSGRLIGYVDPVHVQRHPLEETRQAGDRKREEWLRDLAKRSVSGNWEDEERRKIVEDEVKTSPHLNSGAMAAKSEGLLACHAAVRSDFDRLQRLRDEAWERDRPFFRRVKHGPHQLLVDVLRRASRAHERQYVATIDDYLQYMHKQYKWRIPAETCK